MIITKKIEINGKKGKMMADVMFDSGSGSSFIRKDVAEKIANIIPYPENKYVKLGNGSIAEIVEVAAIAVDIKGCKIIDSFSVMKDMPDDVIIGADIMQKINLVLDFEKDDIDTSKCRMSRM